MIRSNKFYELDDVSYPPQGWENINLSNNELLIPKKDDPATRVADLCQKKVKKIIVDITPEKEVKSSLEANTTAISQDSNSSVRKINSKSSKKSEVVTENAKETNKTV